MRSARTFAVTLSVLMPLCVMAGCSSSKTSAPGKPRPDVMDLNDTPAAPIPSSPRTQVAPMPAPPEAAGAAEMAGPRKHVVAAKDTLYALSKTYYGDSKQWKKIVDANPGLVPEKMPVGMTIIIP